MSSVGFSVSGGKDSIKFAVVLDKKEVSRAKVNIGYKSWEVSEWYTDAEYQHKGYGSLVLKQAMVYAHACTGNPLEITYIWNGENQYVMDWLERNFKAECTCPLVVLKYSPADDRESHIYNLDVNSVLAYIGVA